MRKTVPPVALVVAVLVVVLVNPRKYLVRLVDDAQVERLRRLQRSAPALAARSFATHQGHTFALDAPSPRLRLLRGKVEELKELLLPLPEQRLRRDQQDAARTLFSATSTMRSRRLPSMNTYLVRDGRLYLARPQDPRGDEGASSWRLEGHQAVQEHHFSLKLIDGPRSVRVYGTCQQCPPVLVRTDGTTWLGDLVDEREVFVDLLLTFRPGEPLQVERTSGTRDELKQDLRARGLYVLEDHEALAVAHQEVKRARERSGRSTRW